MGDLKSYKWYRMSFKLHAFSRSNFCESIVSWLEKCKVVFSNKRASKSHRSWDLSFWGKSADISRTKRWNGHTLQPSRDNFVEADWNTKPLLLPPWWNTTPPPWSARWRLQWKHWETSRSNRSWIRYQPQEVCQHGFFWGNECFPGFWIAATLDSTYQKLLWKTIHFGICKVPCERLKQSEGQLNTERLQTLFRRMAISIATLSKEKLKHWKTQAQETSEQFKLLW